MKHLLILICFLFFISYSSFSCDCVYIGYGDKLTNLDFEIEASDFIVAVKIIKELDSLSSAYYTFEIIKTWKGNTENISFIKSGIGGPDCGSVFEIDSIYLLYGNFENDMIYTNACTRTTKLSSTGDIDYLNYHFFNANYDTLLFTHNEFDYLKQHLINYEIDSLFSRETSLIFFEDKLISKKQLLGINPNALTIEFMYFSLGDRKLLKPELLSKSQNGIIILYSGTITKQTNRYKLIKKLNKCTAANK